MPKVVNMDPKDFSGTRSISKKTFPRFRSFRRKLYALFDDPHSSRAAWIIWLSILVMIIVSTISFILESLPRFRFPQHGLAKTESHLVFVVIETVCIIGFSVQYVVRLFCVTSLTEEELNIATNANGSCATGETRKVCRHTESKRSSVFETLKTFENF